MNLNKNSWHYRNFDAWKNGSHSRKHGDLRRGDRQPDLCTYTRIALVYGPTRRVGRWLRRMPEWLGVVLTVLVAYVAVTAAYLPSFPLLTAMYASLMLFLLMTAVVALASAVLYLIFIIKEDLDDFRDREPSLVTSYVKAKKSKICPLIEFEE